MGTILQHMNSDWTKADFKATSQLEGTLADQFRAAQESLARDLSIDLSAFLRSAVTATFTGAEQILFGDFLKEDNSTCFGVALLRAEQRRVLMELDYSVLFPLIGIALGAKAGSFASPGRKPTEIEFQVVMLLFRMIFAETQRAWSASLKLPFELVAVEIEKTPTRSFAVTDPVFVARFELARRRVHWAALPGGAARPVRRSDRPAGSRRATGSRTDWIVGNGPGLDDAGQGVAGNLAGWIANASR